VIDFAKSVRARAKQQSQPLADATLATILRNQQRFGGLVIHLGVVFLFAGLTGNLLNSEYSLTLQPNRPAQAGEYQLLFKGMKEEKVRNATLRMAEIEVYRDNELLEVLNPARSFYPTQPDPLTEVAIRRTLAEDLYLVLVNENSSGSVTIRARINPLIVWAWFAFPLFSVGTVIAMLYRPRRLEAPARGRGLAYARAKGARA
jgi:cytochrome c-type biogenesis protein CcmF